MILWHLFLHLTGSDNVSGPWYGFWSGFAGDIPVLGIGVVLWRRHNCHEPGCWRIQFRAHPDDEGHVVCRKHHPRG